MITKLDRLARSASQGIFFIEDLLTHGISVHVLNMGLMDSTPTGRLLRSILLAFSEFERDMIVERTQEGGDYQATTEDAQKSTKKNSWNMQFNC